MDYMTLCLFVTDHGVWLAKKKRKIGKGKWNGHGGFVEGNEYVINAAIREVKEEACVKVEKEDLDHVAILNLLVEGKEKYICYVFLVKKWKGVLQETEEMTKPRFFPFESIPFHNMIPGDEKWLSYILNGMKIKATVDHDKDFSHVRMFSFVTLPEEERL